MKQYLLLLAASLCFLHAEARKPADKTSSSSVQTITIENPTADQRSELISISAQQLGVKPRSNIVVRDVFGIEQPTQWTYDGNLLFSIFVRPNGKTTYTVQQGSPAIFTQSWVNGRHYPDRLDDIAFENDRIGFRLYGPELQRRGEKGFGHDVWVKRTTELMLDELYRNNGRILFHLDYGKALDCYAVGPTLGCGTPAMLRDGKIVFPWCYKTYKILDKGPLRFTVQVNFATSADGTTEHRILSLDKGSNFCEATVWYDGVNQPVDIAAGLAIRPSQPDGVVIADDYVHYADPTIDPQRHQCQIYVALLFPGTPVTITQQQGHALGILKNYQGGRFHYYFGAAWSEFDVRSQAEWQLRIQGFMQARKQPLKISVQQQ